MTTDTSHMTYGGNGSHWDGCDAVHWDCRIAKLEAENERLRIELEFATGFIQEIASGFKSHPEYDEMDDGDSWREAVRWARLTLDELQNDTQEPPDA